MEKIVSVSPEPTVVPRLFGCYDCGTLWYCNRAEPDCAVEHPGLWHVQTIDFAAEPCESCESWIGPIAEQEANYALFDAGQIANFKVIMFPPEPILNDVVDGLWKLETVMAVAIRMGIQS